MDRINGLSDDLLIKILSFLPTKVAVSTCILSKRWDSLWMWLPKLDYTANESLRCFLDRTLPLHRASNLESFRLICGYYLCEPEDVRHWVDTAVSRCVRELDLSYSAYSDKQCILPSSLYACKSLVVLKLAGNIHLNVPCIASLPCLKTLELQHVTGLNEESLRRLLSICPLLENLFMESNYHGNNRTIIVTVPSLQSLLLIIHGVLDELQIDTPSLKYLKLVDENYHLSLTTNLPKLEEAYVIVNFPMLKSLMGSITSVKRLTLCSDVLSDRNLVFNQLEHLTLCDCSLRSSNVLDWLLKASPNLQALEIFKMDHDGIDMERWNQPSIVPTFLLSSLQTFSWSGYSGKPGEKDVVFYILQNACRLKTAKFWSGDRNNPKLEILKELSLSSRASTTCQLIFD